MFPDEFMSDKDRGADAELDLQNVQGRGWARFINKVRRESIGQVKIRTQGKTGFTYFQRTNSSNLFNSCKAFLSEEARKVSCTWDEKKRAWWESRGVTKSSWHHQQWEPRQVQAIPMHEVYARHVHWQGYQTWWSIQSLNWWYSLLLAWSQAKFRQRKAGPYVNCRRDIAWSSRIHGERRKHNDSENSNGVRWKYLTKPGTFSFEKGTP